jgi:ketosteroid isomerase-like protein
VLELMTDDVEVVPVLGDVVSADRFRGHAGVAHWYETVTSTLEDFRADIEDVVEVGDQRYLVKLRFSGHGRASGAPVTLNAAHLMTLDAGRVVRLVGYQTWEEAEAAAGDAD